MLTLLKRPLRRKEPMIYFEWSSHAHPRENNFGTDFPGRGSSEPIHGGNPATAAQLATTIARQLAKV